MAFSIAVFPFLKTSGPVRIGKHCFRSTSDVEGLPDDQAAAVREISDMLFVTRDLRVVSGSYTILHSVHVNSPGEELDRMIEIRAVVAYIYSQPHEVFDSIFLTPEDCSLHVLSPDKVSKFLVRPDHHTISVDQFASPQEPDQHGFLQGYAGLFNLSRPFWVETDSRLYPPLPHITLNIAQNLANDLDNSRQFERNPTSALSLLDGPRGEVTKRIFTALNWYNFANEQFAGPDRALLNLAIAFEALLMLPEDAKTDRFVDAVSLLLGRTERIDVWARQFYSARSRVAHEGSARGLHVYPNDLSGKQGTLDCRAASLMFYGRQIFQLCVTTLLTGSELARRGDLREKLATHGERLTGICTTLNKSGISLQDKLTEIGPHVAALQRYRFLESGSISVPLMIGAVRALCAAILHLDDLHDALRAEIERCASPPIDKGELNQLEAVKALHEMSKTLDRSDTRSELLLLHQLTDFVWNATFTRYFRLREAGRK